MVKVAVGTAELERFRHSLLDAAAIALTDPAAAMRALGRLQETVIVWQSRTPVREEATPVVHNIPDSGILLVDEIDGMLRCPFCPKMVKVGNPHLDATVGIRYHIRKTHPDRQFTGIRRRTPIREDVAAGTALASLPVGAAPAEGKEAK